MLPLPDIPELDERPAEDRCERLRCRRDLVEAPVDELPLLDPAVPPCDALPAVVPPVEPLPVDPPVVGCCAWAAEATPNAAATVSAASVEVILRSVIQSLLPHGGVWTLVRRTRTLVARP